MKSPLIKFFGLLFALLMAVPSLALMSVASSSSSNQTCTGVSSSSAASSQAPVPSLSCQVIVNNDWNTGYQIAVRVTNTGTVALDNWRVYLTVPAGHVYVNGWGAIITLSSTQIELRKPTGQGPLLPGQSVEIGAQFSKPAGSTGYPSCHTQIVPPPNTAPQGDFTAQVTNDTVHVQTRNASDAEGDKLTYSFDFGDGTIIGAADVWHSYTVPGNYTITQTISDGKLTKVNKTAISVTAAGANHAPSAVFSYSTRGLSASLNANGSADKDGQALTYTWDFGQGLSSASTNPYASVTLPQGGGNVVLTVFDGELGNTLEYKVPANACITYDAAPQLAFTIASNGLSINLDASASRVVDSFSWDFGDGSTGTGMFASHSYAAPGTYTVTLRGLAQYISKTITQTIIVNSVTPVDLPPVAELSCRELTGVADDFTNGIAYYFYAASCDARASFDPEGKPLTYTMNWGDGKTSTSTTGTLVHDYQTGGEFTLTLQVSDGVNTTVKTLPWTATAPTNSNRPPVACFDIASGTDLNANASCSSDADGNALTYSWDFGDGSSATGVATTHSYSASGSYIVKLTVSDGKATSTLSKTFVYTKAVKPTRCEFKITNGWNTGFNGWLRVYNQSTAPVSNWGAKLTFVSGATVSASWNGTVTGSNPYQVAPASWNNTINPGSYVEVGFQVWDGSSTHLVPQVSGVSCE